MLPDDSRKLESKLALDDPMLEIYEHRRRVAERFNHDVEAIGEYYRAIERTLRAREESRSRGRRQAAPRSEAPRHAPRAAEV